MIYLHEAPYNEKFVRHWANEVADNTAGDYDIAVYKIRQVETDIVYDDAIDVMPCRYTYEATDEPIEKEMAEVTA